MIVVVLAGGRSTRFPGNKLLAKIDGRRLIEHVYREAERVAEAVYVSVSDERQAALYGGVLGLGGESFIVDDPAFGRGPLCGMLTSIFRGGLTNVLFIPADLPHLRSEHIEEVASRLSSLKAQAATLMWPNGRLESLWMYYRGGLGGDVAELYREVARRFDRRPTDMIRIVGEAALYPIGGLRVEPLAFRDLDMLNAGPPRRSAAQGRVETVVIKHGETVPLLKAFRAFLAGDVSSAIEVLLAELREYLELGVSQLVRQAALDIATFTRASWEAGGTP